MSRIQVVKNKQMNEKMVESTPPPRGTREQVNLNLSGKSPMVIPRPRPLTPARRSKQEFVFELWNTLCAMIEPILPNKNERNKNDLSKDGSFKQISTVLRDPKVNELMARFWAVLLSFVKCQRLKKGLMQSEMKEARRLLSAIIIRIHPLDVLELDTTDCKVSKDAFGSNVYECAKQVVFTIFENKPKNINQVSKLNCEVPVMAGKNFLIAFESWKSKDEMRVLDSLKQYHEEWIKSKAVLMNSSMNEMQKQSVFDVIDSNMQQSKKRIEQLIGNERSKIVVENIQSKVDKMDLTLYLKRKKRNENENKNKNENNNKNKNMKEINLDEILKSEGQKKYWNDFGKEIEENKYHRLFEILNEILNRLKMLSANSNSKYLDELIDVSFVEHCIKYGVLDAKAFYSIFSGIWTHLKTLHAPVNDKKWIEWHDTIVKSMESKNAKWCVILPNVLNCILLKMDEIEDSIDVFNHMIKKGSKFKKKE